MQPTTTEDRRKELESLLRQIREHPEHDMTAERDRARVLSEMMAREEQAGNQAGAL
jgi:hypothetical protein